MLDELSGYLILNLYMEIIVKRKRLNHHRGSFTFFSSSTHLQTVAPEAAAAKRTKNKTNALKS